MIVSMTGFCARTGASDGYGWSWDIRSVNAKGLDIRTRMPDWANALDVELRKILKSKLSRGNVSVSLRVVADDSADTQSIDETQVDKMLAAIQLIETRAADMGQGLAPSKAADLLSVRGVLGNASTSDIPDGLIKALRSDFDSLLDGFLSMRKAEGAELAKVLNAQVAQIEALVTDATQVLPAREAEAKTNLQAALQRITDNVDGVDADRIAQELAVLAVKSDVTEEIDRLNAHIAAAGELLATKGPVGRKLDFLCQEFNREANTLCSKSNFAELTKIGLELKVVIDQMREQIQNVE